MSVVDGLDGMSGRAVIVAGGESALKSALCERLERSGARVVEMSAARSRDDAIAGVAAATARLGAVDALVTSPPEATAASLGELDVSAFREHIDMAVKSPFLLTQAVLPAMQELGEGRLLYVTSAAGILGRAYLAHVAAGARATIALMRTVVAEAAPAVTANAIAVGPMEGDPLEAARARSLVDVEGMDLAQAHEQVRERIPTRRLTQPEEVADAACWALTPASGFVTGQVLALAGGSELQVWP